MFGLFRFQRHGAARVDQRPFLSVHDERERFWVCERERFSFWVSERERPTHLLSGASASVFGSDSYFWTVQSANGVFAIEMIGNGRVAWRATTNPCDPGRRSFRRRRRPPDRGRRKEHRPTVHDVRMQHDVISPSPPSRFRPSSATDGGSVPADLAEEKRLRPRPKPPFDEEPAGGAAEAAPSQVSHGLHDGARSDGVPRPPLTRNTVVGEQHDIEHGYAVNNGAERSAAERALHNESRRGSQFFRLFALLVVSSVKQCNGQFQNLPLHCLTEDKFDYDDTFVYNVANGPAQAGKNTATLNIGNLREKGLHTYTRVMSFAPRSIRHDLIMTL